MERNQILNEFLNLRKSLNQGNKLANELTQFRFEIVPIDESEFRLLAVVFGRFDRNAIELARRDKFGNWERSGYTKFRRLENFCAEFLNETSIKKQRGGRRVQKVSINEMQILSLNLLNEFDQLLVNYSP